jgi:hypothetical protein
MEEILSQTVNTLALSMFGLVVLYHFVNANTNKGRKED